MISAPLKPMVPSTIQESDTNSDIDVGDGADDPVPHPAPMPDRPNTKVLAETESLISKNTEMIQQLQGKLKMEKQPYKDHCYPLLINRYTGLPAADICLYKSAILSYLYILLT